MSRALISRRHILAGVAAGTVASVASLSGGRIAARADDGHHGDEDGITGAWQAVIQVNGVPKPFDALYGFARGGLFTRIDGRSNTASATLANAPSLGTWMPDGDSLIITFVVYSYDQAGQRVGTITANERGTVDENGVMSGPFTAYGVKTDGSPLPGFPKAGTFTATRIEPTAP